MRILHLPDVHPRLRACTSLTPGVYIPGPERVHTGTGACTSWKWNVYILGPEEAQGLKCTLRLRNRRFSIQIVHLL